MRLCLFVMSNPALDSFPLGIRCTVSYCDNF